MKYRKGTHLVLSHLEKATEGLLLNFVDNTKLGGNTCSTGGKSCHLVGLRQAGGMGQQET